MRRVTSVDEYYALIRQSRANAGALKVNYSMFADAIKRYIDLGRMYCDQGDFGIVFYTDEDGYYQALYQWNPGVPFVLSRKDKPVLLQNVYKGEKQDWLLKLEAFLSADGFQLKDTMKHGVFVGYDSIPQLRRSIQAAERIFQRNGLKYAPLRRDQIPEMLAFRKTITEIPYYQIPYFTDDELAEEAEAERLICVMDAQGKIIAVRHLIVYGKKAYGWVGIEEQYKSLYGVALVILGHALDYIAKNDVKMCSWVETTNIPSLQYHERLGTEWTGYMEDEWLLE